MSLWVKYGNRGRAVQIDTSGTSNVDELISKIQLRISRLKDLSLDLINLEFPPGNVLRGSLTIEKLSTLDTINEDNPLRVTVTDIVADIDISSLSGTVNLSFGGAINVVLQEQPPLRDSTSHSWRIENLFHAGLAVGNEVQIHYIRLASLNLNNVLTTIQNQHKDRRIWVKGCPGIGKSTTVYGWTVNQALERNQKILWIHRMSDLWNKGLVIQYRKGSVVEIETSHLPMISKYAEKEHFDIIVLDGIRANMESLAQDCGIRCPDAMLIVCTSFQSAVRSSEDEVRVPISSLVMDSWEYGDYVSARDAGVINFSLEELDRRYYFAGGSIRHFFIDEDRVIESLDEHMNKVDNFSSLLKGLKGVSSAGTSNTLIKIIGGSTTIVSQYVMKRLARYVDEVFVSQAKAIWRDNPAWQGWVLELEFFVKVFNGTLMTATLAKDVDADPIKWPTNIVWVKDGSELCAMTLDDNSMICPLRWNQGCFDFIVYYHRGRAFPGNVTRSPSHTCKFKYLTPFLNHLGDPHLHSSLANVKTTFLFVVPTTASSPVSPIVEDLDMLQQIDHTFDATSFCTVRMLEDGSNDRARKISKK